MIVHDPGGCHPRVWPGLSRAPARALRYSDVPPAGLGVAGGSRKAWGRCGGRQSGPGPGGPEGRGGLEAARRTEDVFWVDFDIALVGVGLPAPQELDVCVWDANLFCPCGCAPAEGVTGIVPRYALLQ